MALILVGLKLDAASRLAALLFAVPTYDEHGIEHIEARFGHAAAHLVGGISRLNRLRPITRDSVADAAESPQEMKAQIEVLRKMLLAMVEDIRVVLLRLASRTQTLRYYASSPDDLRAEVARETLEIYSPLANRLGIWELKWELEDLSFRFLHPDIYKKVAKQLDEKRTEREHHCRCDRTAADRAGRCRHHGCRSLWATEAHLQHLEQDAEKGCRFFRGLRCPGAASDRP